MLHLMNVTVQQIPRDIVRSHAASSASAGGAWMLGHQEDAIMY